ncbi:hypothetical protein EV368DRAFT_68544 [Lentinula lateritia]|nr:hypothetical protein EV368DRAFT_68544 [Lentinula lateritia]
MNRKRKAFDDIFDSNRKHQPLLSDPSNSANLTLSGSSSSHVSPAVAISSSSQIPALQTTPSFQPFVVCGTSTSRTFTQVFKGRIEPTTLVDRSMSLVESSTTGGSDHDDYELSVMASAVLNGDDVLGSRPPAAIDDEDLNPLVTLIQDAVTNMNVDTMTIDTTRTGTDDTMTTDMTMNGDTNMTTASYKMKNVFDSAAAQNRTIHQSLRRIQSHRVVLQDRLTLLQNLSPDHDTAAVQETLLRAERTVVAISSELDKYRRKEVKSEVEAAKEVARCLEGLLQTWRTLHPDSSPIEIDNSSHACNPTSAKNTPTLIAYSLALVGRIMERMSRRSCSLLLKSIRLFGYSLTILQEGGPNRQQQVALTDIPEDIRALEKKFKLDIKTNFKAARPFAGLLDVGSHCYCFTCKTWHRAYLNSTNYEDWEAVDDDFLREGAEKWRDAQTKAERIAIEEQYGVRYSQFWRLPYWRPSKQVTTDPMHTGYQLLEKNFFRDGLRLNNPESKEDPKNKSTAPSSTYAHHYAFTPPPPLQFVGSNHVIQADVDNEDEIDESTLITGLEWDHLLGDLRSLRNQRMMVLGNDLRSSPRLLGQLSDIHTLLSDLRPSTTSELVQLRTRLGRMNWTTLLFVCEDLLALKSPSVLRMEIIQKSQITKDDMIDALVDWRLDLVHEDGPFVWPHFTPTHHGPPRSAQSPTITYYNGSPCCTLTDSEKEPINNSEMGKVKLANILNTKNRVALLFVCLDLNRVPMNISHRIVPKKDLISQLVDWRLTQPKEAICWTPVDSPTVLERIQQAVREVIVPGWIAKPSDSIGLPRGGTPKADNWRTLFSIFLPLALLSLWQEASPISAEDANEMASVLRTSMYLTCAVNKMSKHTLSLQDRADFREYLRLHIEGLKENFPGFIQPSHHLAFHIYDDMDLFSAVHHFWCFPGERLIGFLKRIPVNHKTTQLIEKTYGLGKLSLETGAETDTTKIQLEDVEAILKSDSHLVNALFRIPTPRGLYLVLDVDSITRIQCYNRCLTPFGDYYAISEASGIGNSYVCFFPGGNRDVEWVSGQIRHIFCEDGRIRFSIQRSLPKPLAEGQQDPFKAFWDQGFQAKTVSSTFTTHFEFVEYDWVFAHTARWDLSPAIYFLKNAVEFGIVGGLEKSIEDLQ